MRYFRYRQEYDPFSLITFEGKLEEYEMNFNEYQTQAKGTAVYPQDYAILYPALGLAGESGEVCEKLKKAIRVYGKDWKETLDKDSIARELGDVLWYISAVCSDMGITLDSVAHINLMKLADRKERSVLKGEGDYR